MQASRTTTFEKRIEAIPEIPQFTPCLAKTIGGKKNFYHEVLALTQFSGQAAPYPGASIEVYRTDKRKRVPIKNKFTPRADTIHDRSAKNPIAKQNRKHLMSTGFSLSKKTSTSLVAPDHRVKLLFSDQTTGITFFLPNLPAVKRIDHYHAQLEEALAAHERPAEGLPETKGTDQPLPSLVYHSVRVYDPDKVTHHRPLDNNNQEALENEIKIQKEQNRWFDSLDALTRTPPPQITEILVYAQISKDFSVACFENSPEAFYRAVLMSFAIAYRLEKLGKLSEIFPSGRVPIHVYVNGKMRRVEEAHLHDFLKNPPSYTTPNTGATVFYYAEYLAVLALLAYGDHGLWAKDLPSLPKKPRTALHHVLKLYNQPGGGHGKTYKAIRALLGNTTPEAEAAFLLYARALNPQGISDMPEHIVSKEVFDKFCKSGQKDFSKVRFQWPYCPFTDPDYTGKINSPIKLTMSTKDLKKFMDDIQQERSKPPEGRLSFPVDLSGLDFSKEDYSNRDFSGFLLRNANFKGANLTGANLRGADLTGAKLKNAILTGVSIQDATLDQAAFEALRAQNITDFSGCILKGPFKKIKIVGCNFTGAHFQGSFKDLSFENCDLRNANMESARLPSYSFTSSKIATVKFPADLKPPSTCGPSFFQTLVRQNILNFSKCTFTGDYTNLSFEGCDLSYADLEGATLTNTTVKGATLGKKAFLRFKAAGVTDFSNCTFIGSFENVDFSGCDLTDASLTDLLIKGATLDLKAFQAFRRQGITDFSRCTLIGDYAVESFKGCDLSCADLEGATLKNTTVKGATLGKKAFLKFKEAGITDFSNCKFIGSFEEVSFEGCDLAGAQFTEATFNQNTSFTGASLIGVKFSESQLSQITDFTQASYAKNDSAGCPSLSRFDLRTFIACLLRPRKTPENHENPSALVAREMLKAYISPWYARFTRTYYHEVKDALAKKQPYQFPQSPTFGGTMYTLKCVLQKYSRAVPSSAPAA